MASKKPKKVESVHEVTDAEREWCAVFVLRQAMLNHAERTGQTFEDCFLELCESGFYEVVFDYELRFWAEGPEYVLDQYLRYKNS